MIMQADARALPLRDESVQCCVTSPPYWWLRDYGTAQQIGLEVTPDAYVSELVTVFQEVRRVLKPDGVCWMNLGDCYANDGKFGGKQAYLRKRCGREKRVTGLKPKELIGIPWRVAFALQADGWWLRQDIIWSKPNPMPESVRDRCTKAHEYVFLLTKAERYYWDAEAMREPASDRGRVNGRGGRVENPMSRPPGTSPRKLARVDYTEQGRNRRSVWTITTQPTPDAHFATMPESLVEPCVLAGTKPGDVVLDPFLGSGTVGRVATSLGRRFVGTELSWDYCVLAAQRCRVTRGLPLEFSASDEAGVRATAAPRGNKSRCEVVAGRSPYPSKGVGPK